MQTATYIPTGETVTIRSIKSRTRTAWIVRADGSRETVGLGLLDYRLPEGTPGPSIVGLNA